MMRDLQNRPMPMPQHPISEFIHEDTPKISEGKDKLIDILRTETWMNKCIACIDMITEG